MEWIRVEVKTAHYGAELAMGVLISSGVNGAEIIDATERVRHLAESVSEWDYAEDGLLSAENDDVFVVFYVEKNEKGGELLATVREELTQLQSYEPAVAFEIATMSADDSTWLNEWKKHFKPFHIGRVLIVPEWEAAQVATHPATDEMASRRQPSTHDTPSVMPPPAGGQGVVFVIDPGSAFGTGQHETTRLCIDALQDVLCDGDVMLDVGCGSGILSIVGLLCGAGEVFACDIDPAGAIAATKKNAQLNAIDNSRLTIRAGNALSDEHLRAEIRGRKYDVVVANIVADVVMELVPFVREILADNGTFIASGIIEERVGEVLASFAGGGMAVEKHLNLQGWHCFVARHEVCA